MNYWTKLSIEYANQRNYLDNLFAVYPTIPDDIRNIDDTTWKNFESAYNAKQNQEMIEYLLNFELFPIKDSYVAYLRRDKNSIHRNPKTINRLAGRLYEMGLDKIYEKCTEPKETNRQIGPLFKRWIEQGTLGLNPVTVDIFRYNQNDAILSASDEEMKIFAQNHLGYTGDKGLDFIARFNNKYVIGEAKFLTDFWGHQNAQMNDAVSLIKTPVKHGVVKIAILDGVLYIPSKNKMHKMLSEYAQYNIMGAGLDN